MGCLERETNSMPRLRRKKKNRKVEFTRSLARFLKDPLKKLWFFGNFAAVRRGEHSAYLKNITDGSIKLTVLKGAEDSVGKT